MILSRASLHNTPPPLKHGHFTQEQIVHKMVDRQCIQFVLSFFFLEYNRL